MFNDKHKKAFSRRHTEPGLLSWWGEGVSDRSLGGGGEAVVRWVPVQHGIGTPVNRQTDTTDNNTIPRTTFVAT